MLRAEGKLPLFFTCSAALLLVFYYWPFLNGQASFYYVDHSAFFEPYCRYIGQRLAGGQLPLWNPLPGCGQSQLAIASPGIFFPFNWLFAFLPYSQAVALQMVFHQGLAMVAALLLIKRWGWGDAPAAIGALIVAFGGYMFSLSQNFTIVATAAWMLMALYAVQLAQEEDPQKCAAGTVSAALCTGLMLLAGRPEIWAPGLVLLVCISALPVVRHGNRQCARRVFVAAIPVVCGVLVAMPSLLPTAQWALLSPRAGGFIRPNPLSTSVSWYDFIGMIFAAPLGSPITAGNPFTALLQPDQNTQVFIPTLFVGPLSATLALVGALDKRWRHRWPVVAALIVGIGCVAGTNLFFMPLLLKFLPLLGFVRYPVKFAFFLQCLIAVLAARGAYVTISDAARCARAWTLAIVCWLVVLLAGALMLIWPEGSWFGFHQFAQQYAGSFAGSAIFALGSSFVLWAAVGLLFSGVALWGCRDKGGCRGQPMLAGAWVVVVSLASILTAVAWQYTRYCGEADFYKHPSLVADIVHRFSADSTVAPRVARLVTGAPGYGIPVNYHSPGAAQGEADICQYQRQLCLLNTTLNFGLSSLCPYEGALTPPAYIIGKVLIDPNVARAFPPLQQAILARICQMTNCGFTISQVWLGSGVALPTLRSDLFHLLSENRALNVRVYGTVDPLPFAYFVRSAIWVANSDAALRLLLAKPPGDLDVHKVVLLCHGFHDSVRQPPTLPDSRSPARAVAVDRLAVADQRIVIDVTAPDSGYVVVADSFYPGWHAYVDGRQVEVLCANSMLKAVPVQAGKHHITLAFEPEVLFLSIVLAAAGAILLVVFALLGLCRSNWIGQDSNRLVD